MGITIEGDADTLTRKLGNMRRRVQNPTRAWRSVGRFLSMQVNRQFVTEGAHFGRKWKPLKPAYRLWKIRNGYGRKILVQTGEMKRSFTGRPMAIEEYMGNTAVFGSDNIKAIWHHNGTHRNGKQVNPARPILIITREVRDGVRDKLADYVLGKDG